MALAPWTLSIRAALVAASLACAFGCDRPAQSPTTGANSTGVSSTGGGAGGEGGASPCEHCDEPTVVGHVQHADLVELSGLVASAIHPGVYYAHNDSGYPAVLYAIDTSGATRGVYDVAGAESVDWEDIARGPCEGAGSCLYVGDIGDNRRQRERVAVYRVREPEVLEVGGVLEAEAMPFVYPDGPRDAETLLVHPETGVVTVVEKRIGPAAVYELPMPLTPGEQVTATLRGSFEVPSLLPYITAADVDTEASRIALRTYPDVWIYPVGPNQSLAEALLSGVPCEGPVGPEPQGEAIAFTLDGSRYLTISEGVEPPVHQVVCHAARR